MMPPTGLTLFIHAGVIIIKKIANLFHRPFCENTYKEETTARQAISSFAIMSLVFVYVLIIITGFVGKAMTDDRATWKIVFRTFNAMHIHFDQKYHEPPEYNDLLTQHSPPLSLFHNNSVIQKSI